MVEATKKYLFTGPDGEVGLADLFEGRRRLIVYHFMWRHAESGFPGQDQGCPTCSFVVDSIGHPAHLHYAEPPWRWCHGRRWPALSGSGSGWLAAALVLLLRQ